MKLYNLECFYSATNIFLLFRLCNNKTYKKSHKNETKGSSVYCETNTKYKGYDL